MTAVKHCIIIAAPRSGTTVLGDSVAQAFGAVLAKEIFMQRHADPKSDYRRDADARTRTNFFNYRRDMFRNRPELSYPTRENQDFLFRAYLDHMERLERASRFVIDVKYTSFHHLDPYYRLPGDVPGLVDILRSLDLPVVHLKRNNLFALYCSLAHAEATGIWATATASGKFPPFAVDPVKCLDYMTRTDAVSRRVDGWFAGRRVWQLAYETLWQDGLWSPTVSNTFEQIFGAPVAPLTAPRLQKLMPPLRTMIANREEVLSSLRGTPFLAMAEAELA